MRILAVDWSGAADPRAARRAIWLAEVVDGTVTRVEDGRTRDDIARHLVDLAATDPQLLVGFDFSFSLPAWFLTERGCMSAVELWEAPEEEREAWLRCDARPFWGRRGARRPEVPAHLRATEARVAVGGIRPKSTFQVSGAGSVGAGSVRGFPTLAALRAHGFAIWPFDDATAPAVLEVWPRLHSGAVVKSDAAARARCLDQLLDDALDAASNACDGAGAAVRVPQWARARAVANEHAFDALVSAVAMARHTDALLALRATTDPLEQQEGAMWLPPSTH